MLSLFGSAMVLALPAAGWCFVTAFDSISDLHMRMVRVEGVTEELIRTDTRITETLDKLAEIADENDRRITRREDNQFTARDGAKMQLQVNEQGTLIAQQAAVLGEIRAEIKSELPPLRNGITRVYQLLAEIRKDQQK